MSQLTGKVVRRNLDGSFGWIEYTPENDDDPEDNQIYFMWDSRRDGVLPDVDAIVTFTKESDPDKPGEYIARNIRVKK